MSTYDPDDNDIQLPQNALSFREFLDHISYRNHQLNRPVLYMLLPDNTTTPLDERVHDPAEWEEILMGDRKFVNRTTIECVDISTVFLGIDHQWMPEQPPLLFETRIFGLDCAEGYTRRCSTWDEAEQQHNDAVALVQQELERYRMLRTAQRVLDPEHHQS